MLSDWISRPDLKWKMPANRDARLCDYRNSRNPTCCSCPNNLWGAVMTAMRAAEAQTPHHNPRAIHTAFTTVPLHNSQELSRIKNNRNLAPRLVKRVLTTHSLEPSGLPVLITRNSLKRKTFTHPRMPPHDRTPSKHFMTAGPNHSAVPNAQNKALPSALCEYSKSSRPGPVRSR